MDRHLIGPHSSVGLLGRKSRMGSGTYTSLRKLNLTGTGAIARCNPISWRHFKFWGDRGVDGFRVDTAFLLSKELADELPTWDQLITGSGSAGEGGYPPGGHPLWDRDELDEIYRDWRTVFDSYNPPLFAVAEAWVSVERRIRYAQPTSLGQAFNFDLLQAKWDAETFRRVISESIGFARRSGSSSTWVLSNHDVVRHATRYGLPQDAVEVFGGSNDLGIADEILGVRQRPCCHPVDVGTSRQRISLSGGRARPAGGCSPSSRVPTRSDVRSR